MKKRMEETNPNEYHPENISSQLWMIQHGDLNNVSNLPTIQDMTQCLAFERTVVPNVESDLPGLPPHDAHLGGSLVPIPPKVGVDLINVPPVIVDVEDDPRHHLLPRLPKISGKKRKSYNRDSLSQPPKKRKRRTRRKKDPNAPKRPQTAYLIFYREHVPEYIRRDDFRNKNGNIDMTLVSKDIGKRWKTLGEEDKERYRLRYEEQRKEYVKALSTYNEQKRSETITMAEPEYEEETQPVENEQYFKTEVFVGDSEPLKEVINEYRRVRRDKRDINDRLVYFKEGILNFQNSFAGLHEEFDGLMDVIRTEEEVVQRSGGVQMQVEMPNVDEIVMNEQGGVMDAREQVMQQMEQQQVIEQQREMEQGGIQKSVRQQGVIEQQQIVTQQDINNQVVVMNEDGDNKEDK